ncbi:hypothetical protein [Mycobacterium simulans]|uniref:hypothetical protein n=1 Tax=Mycobacterium simulans TaxID=627089 RepID=UPI0021B36FF0|nr:hypothetical protein [Mycobacterium simulans]
MSSAPKRMRCFARGGLLVDPARDIDVVSGGQDLDDLVVGDVGDGGRIAAAPAAR